MHVHDLVDNVSIESHIAGKNAAKYIKGKKFDNKNGDIEIIAIDGIRYTVPKFINIYNVEDFVEVRFRVGNVYKNNYISVYFDEVRELHMKKRILTPGEMEQVRITKAMLLKYPQLKKLLLK